MIINGHKICGLCKKNLPISSFIKSNQRGDGYIYRCKPCHSKKSIEWQSNNKEQKNAYIKKWVHENKDRLYARRKKLYFENRDHMLLKMKRLYAQRKDQIFTAYGHKCACCGEEKREFLCIDHIHGGGCKHRKSKSSSGIYAQIRREGFPKDTYRLLCHNCNMSIGFYGYCPHHPEIIRKTPTGRPRSVP